MIHIKNLTIIVLIFISSTMLCGCPPIKYTFYIRNSTLNTVHLKLNLEEKPDKLSVRYKKEFIDIDSKTFHKLNDSLTAFLDNKNINLNIPMRSTVFMDDFFDTPFFILTNRTLFIQSGNKTDSLKLDYPYRKNKFLKKKRDRPYTPFYRTIIYYDIK